MNIALRIRLKAAEELNKAWQEYAMTISPTSIHFRTPQEITQASEQVKAARKKWEAVK